MTRPTEDSRPSARQRITLPDLKAFGQELAREVREDRILFLASALTFDVLLASVPFMMLLLTLTGLLLEALGGGTLDLHAMLGGAFPDTAGASVNPALRVEQLLSGVAERRVSVSLLSLPLLLLLSTRMYGTVRTVLNEVFHATHERRLIRRRLVEVLLLGLTGVFMLTNGLASVVVGILSAATGSQWVERIGGGVVTFVSAFSLFALVYRVTPEKFIEWRTACVAALSCATFFELAKRGFAMYLRYAVRTEVLTPDAQLAGIMLLLAWMYLTSIVFLMSAELADKYTHLPTSPPGPVPPAV